MNKETLNSTLNAKEQRFKAESNASLNSKNGYMERGNPATIAAKARARSKYSGK